MKFTKSILAKRASAPAVESEVIDQAKIDQLAEKNADIDEVATGGEGIQTAEQKPDTTKDITMSEVDQVVAGESDPKNVVGEQSDEKAPVVKDAGADLPGAVGKGDEVADNKGNTEVPDTENEDETGTAPTETKPDPEADSNEAVATGEETAPSKEDAAAAVAADLEADPVDSPVTEEEGTEASADDTAEAAEEEANLDNAEAGADTESDPANSAEGEATEAEDQPGEEGAAEAAAEVSDAPVEVAAVEVDPTEAGDTTAADEVDAIAVGDDVVVPVEVNEPGEPVVAEVQFEEPVGETEIVVATGAATDGTADTTAAIVAEPEAAPVAVVEGPEATPDFVAVADATDGVVPAATEVDEAFESADVIETDIVEQEPTYEILSEAVQTYPEVVAVLDNALANGGISVEAAALLNIFTQRDGIPAGMNVATESYGGYARSQTRIALESIKESLRQWWADLVKWAKEQRDRLAAWLKSLFDASTAMRKEAEAIIKDAEGLTTDATGDIEVKDPSALVKDGAISTDIARDVTELAQLIGRVYVPLGNACMEGCGKAATVIADLKGDEEKGAVATEIARAFESADAAFRSKLNEPGATDGFRQSKVQIGERVLRGKVGDHNSDVTLSDFATGDECLAFVPVTEETPADLTVKALKLGDAVDTAKAVLALLDAIEETKKMEAPCKTAADKVDAAGEHLVKLAEEDSTNSELVSELRSVVMSLQKEMSTPFSRSMKYFAAVARAALSAARQSLPKAGAAEQSEEA